jgi:hypothetical protein
MMDMGMRMKSLICNDEQVRELLAGNDVTFTRKVEPQPNEDGLDRIVVPTVGPWRDSSGRVYECPLGNEGERLWVRECWAPMCKSRRTRIAYRATMMIQNQTPKRRCANKGLVPWPVERGGRDGHTVERWHSSTQMPQWASRLTAEITNVRVKKIDGVWSWVVTARRVAQ